MTALQAQALLPYFVLSGGIVLLLLLVAWLRSEAVAFGGALAVLVASLCALPTAFAAGAQTVDGLVRIDGFALFFFALFAIAGVVTELLAFRSLAARAAHRQEFHILIAIATLGAAVTACAANFAAFLLGLELLSVSLYVLVAYPENAKPPLEAATKYLVLSGAASSTMLFGMALIYSATGTLAFTAGDVARGEVATLALGQAMLLAGVFFKLSLMPFHMWTPDVYQGAPAAVTGYVATVSKGAAFAVLLRYAFDADLLDAPVVRIALVVVGATSMIGGNLLALLQTNFKRLLAYSSIAHMGYLLIALFVAGAADGGRGLGVEAALVYLTAYFAMTLAAFGVVTALSRGDEEAEEITAYEGLLWRQPVLAAVLIAAMLSLAGIPLTVGFIAKFYLVAAGVEGAAWTLVWALIVGSAIGVYYYVRMVFAVTKRPRDTAHAPTPPAWESVTTVAALGVVIVVFGVYVQPLAEFLRTHSWQP